MKILVTGGTGFIGSHTVAQLLEAGHEPVIVDNLSNSHAAVVDRLKRITGQKPVFYHTDIRDRPALSAICDRHQFDAVIHFAGFKAVGESVAEPLKYYDNNLGGAITLLEVMAEHHISRLIFSSSCTVYGEPETVPITEATPIRPVNPYGQTKAMIEQLLHDATGADPKLAVAVLRYFNPIGAHPSGLIGEDPQGVPNNLLPYLAQVAAGRRSKAQIFGNDYPTPDGTGVRDYIHVMDLAEGHLSALDRLAPGWAAYNLGTGRGASVLEVIRALETASDRPIPYRITGRRPGDAASVYADASKARTELGWKARHTLADACRDLWNWQQRNPQGFSQAARDDG